MEAIAKSDIFFLITSVSIIITTILIVVALYYIIQTLKNVRDISNTVKHGIHTAESELGEIGERITGSSLFTFIFGRKAKGKK